MTEPTCGTCRYFHRYNADQPGGGCHRYPPTALIVGANKHQITGRVIPQVDGFWAPTADGEVCGEHVAGLGIKRTMPVATAEQVALALAGVEVEGSA